MNCVFERFFVHTKMAFRIRVFQHSNICPRAQINIKLLRLDADHQPGPVTAHGIKVNRRRTRNGNAIPCFRIQSVAVALPYGAITKYNALTATLSVSRAQLQDTVERLVLALAVWDKAKNKETKSC